MLMFTLIATLIRCRWLGVPGEHEYRGHGVSSCATCDGFLYRGAYAFTGDKCTFCFVCLYYELRESLSKQLIIRGCNLRLHLTSSTVYSMFSLLSSCILLWTCTLNLTLPPPSDHPIILNRQACAGGWWWRHRDGGRVGLGENIQQGECPLGLMGVIRSIL